MLLNENSDSPCIGVCSTLFDDVCKGCKRTALEVEGWIFMSEKEKEIVWYRLKDISVSL